MDEEALANWFDTLSSPMRVRILLALREQRSIRKLSGTRNAQGNVLTSEDARHHVKRLVEAGLAQAYAVQGGSDRVVYQARSESLLLLAKKLVRIAQNERANRSEAERDEASFCLSIVDGDQRGARIPLEPEDLPASRGWVIGHSTRCDVPLPHDEDVEDKHAEIQIDDDGLSLVDFRTSGPTSLNMSPLAKGDTHALKAGDVIGVGSTRLVLQTAP